MKPSDSRLDHASVLLISAEGIVLDANETGCLALGWTREELLNKGMNDVFEYGADLLMDGLLELQGASAESSGVFSVSALVRRSDQSIFPATAIVRPAPEFNAFTIGFDDLSTDVLETASQPKTSEQEVTDLSEIESADAAIESIALGQHDLIPVAGAPADEALLELPRDIQEPHVAPSNGSSPNFRNIFLSGSPRTAAEPLQAKSEVSNPVNGKDDVSAQLEAERQERRRLEARVVSLNDQLQQLHVQLKNNLESESIYHKRVAECESELAKAEESKIAAEAALHEEEQRRESLETEFEELKADDARREQERKLSQREWLEKLESSLKALQESDARLEKEIASRRAIGVKLQLLQQDSWAQSEKQDADVKAAAPHADIEAASRAPRRVAPVADPICA